MTFLPCRDCADHITTLKAASRYREAVRDDDAVDNPFVIEMDKRIKAERERFAKHLKDSPSCYPSIANRYIRSL